MESDTGGSFCQYKKGLKATSFEGAPVYLGGLIAFASVDCLVARGMYYISFIW